MPSPPVGHCLIHGQCGAPARDERRRELSGVTAPVVANMGDEVGVVGGAGVLGVSGEEGELRTHPASGKGGNDEL